MSTAVARCSALGLSAIGAEASCSLAWFSVQTATLTTTATSERHDIMVTGDDYTLGDVTITPTVSTATISLIPTDTNGDVYYMVNGSPVKDAARSKTGSNTSGANLFAQISVQLNATTAAAPGDGLTINDLLISSGKNLKITLAAAVITDDELTAANVGRGGQDQPAAYTKGDIANVKIGSNEAGAYSGSNSLQSGAIDLSAAAWTQVSTTNYKLESAAVFYIALNGGTSSANSGITDVNNLFKVNASVQQVNR